MDKGYIHIHSIWNRKAESNAFVLRDAPEGLSRSWGRFHILLAKCPHLPQPTDPSLAQFLYLSCLTQPPTHTELSYNSWDWQWCDEGSFLLRQENQSLHRKVSVLYTRNPSPILLIHTTRMSHLLNSLCKPGQGRTHTCPTWSKPSQGRECSTHLPYKRFICFFWRGVGNIRRAEGKSEGRREAEEIKTGNEKNEGLCTKTCRNAPSRVWI